MFVVSVSVTRPTSAGSGYVGLVISTIISSPGGIVPGYIENRWYSAWVNSKQVKHTNPADGRWYSAWVNSKQVKHANHAQGGIVPG